MSLTAQDQSDLVGLASETGNPDSDARARNLAQDNPEAASFLRQIASVCKALQVHGQVSPPPLPAEERDALASAILERAGQTRARQSLISRRSWRWAGVAAAIMFAAAIWFSASRHTGPVVAEAFFIPLHVGFKGPPPDRVLIHAAQRVETQDGYAVLKLTSGTRVVARQGTRLTIRNQGEHGGIVELENGTLFIDGSAAIRLQAGDTVISSEGGKLKAMLEMTPPMCRIYLGRAKVTRQGQDTPVSQGQVCTWDRASEGVHIERFLGEPPEWIKMPLHIAAADAGD